MDGMDAVSGLFDKAKSTFQGLRQMSPVSGVGGGSAEPDSSINPKLAELMGDKGFYTHMHPKKVIKAPSIKGGING